MPGTIVVGYDGSNAAKLALDHGAERALATKARLLLVTVVPASLRQAGFTAMILPDLDLTMKLDHDSFVKTAGERLEEVASVVEQRGLQVDTAVRQGDAADELIAAGKEAEAAEIVLGYMSYEHKLPQGIGSIAEKVLRYADRTVTIVRPRKGDGKAR